MVLWQCVELFKSLVKVYSINGTRGNKGLIYVSLGFLIKENNVLHLDARSFPSFIFLLLTVISDIEFGHFSFIATRCCQRLVQLLAGYDVYVSQWA